MQSTSPFTKRLFLGTMLVLLFLIPTLVACGSSNNPSSSSGTPIPLSTAGKPGTDGSTQSVTPGTLLGVQPCPGATKNASYWNRFILPTSGVFSVESVSCANIIGNPSLQALATVRHKDIGTPLDIYVFNNITDATPKRVFQMFGLVQGEAKISGYNTVLTAQADELSALNVGKPVSAMAADLFREFKWSVNTNMLVQTVFPGVFPDLTRYQAEADQAQVNQGHQPWKLSATMVANVLAVSLLNWSTSSSTTLLSGGGVHDVSAVVRVRSTDVVSGSITVTLSRLEGNTNGGIWEAVSVAANSMSITSPTPLTQFLTPIQVTGTGFAFEGNIGQVMVLDHLYNPIGKASAIGVVGEGQTSFSTSLYYQSTFPAGIQEGMLVLYAHSNANGSIAAAVMEKILINGVLERTFAVESVDLVVTPNNIAGMACGSKVTFTYAATFHVPMGTAGGTIQFLYTSNNGRISSSASVTVPPGQSTATYSFTTSGTLEPDHVYPGIAEIQVSSPNVINSPPVKLAGTCS